MSLGGMSYNCIQAVANPGYFQKFDLTKNHGDVKWGADQNGCPFFVAL